MKNKNERNGRAEKLFKSLLIAVSALSLMLLLSACDDDDPVIDPTAPPTPVVTEPVDPVDPVEPEEPAAFDTAVRFIVASDVHIDETNSVQEEARLAKLFEVGYDYSARDSEHPTLDGVFFAGDCANTGSRNAMQKFFNIVNANARPETTVRAVTGNHEYKNNALALVDWKKASGYKDVDFHLNINGFHVIMLCTRFGDQYTPAQAAWLETQIQKALKDDPTKAKPIFVIQHLAPSNTAYGTEDWGSPCLQYTLKKYPQVVDFGGHSHFPINDPRSLWQGGCTVLNTGGLSYYEMGIVGVKTDGIFSLGTEGDYSSSSTARDEAQFWIVEVAEDGRMRVQGYDMFTDSIIVSYDLGPFDSKDNFQYTTQKRLANAQTPTFAETAQTQTTMLTSSKVKLSFPQAQCADTVQHYRCELYCGTERVGMVYRLSNNWYFPMPETLTVSFNKLMPETDYTLKIIAVSPYEKESEPLTVEFRTLSKEAEAASGEMIFSLGFDENGNAVDTVSGSALAVCGAPAAAEGGVYFDGKSCYCFDGFANHYESLEDSVSYEFYGRVDAFAPNGGAYSDVLSNQQSGGCGIEITKDGYAQFYIMVNGTHYYPQAKITAGEPVYLVGTFDGESVKLYVNGELKDTVAAAGVMTMPVNAPHLVVGGDSTTGMAAEALMKGEVRCANVYNYALSDAQIASNYAVLAK